MAIRYPNGKKFSQKRIPEKKKNDKPKDNSYSNRGMQFEEEIQESNEFYLSRGTAVIHKKPTPLQIVQVDYPARSAAVVKEAYFQKPSTTDFNGVYKGLHLDFEAKETRNKTSFPLKNFHDHQVEHMKNVCRQRGLCFILIHFRPQEEIYLYPAEAFFPWYDSRMNGRKSIPKESIENEGYLVKRGFLPRVDYLKAVDELLQDRKEE
ncbi:Holliday junction resolvase RecU [Alkalicoccus urumqiensis]|uniref:Holliday junction resolvase RecU n=1 Tax=Alkalicoccus urumqiensis TaxID=1548213 RepID=A0A2P6MKN9_ALKUR|nr:Holliday junction resolvase RecU [Alkalicoccus urumqiensis]PRO66852.1 Holliday junction resolvase RecU [Alkalicoccus urumqiensis]